MEFNRKRFSQGVDANKIKKQREEAEKKSNFGSSGRAGFHDIKEGKNVFRILPPHDPENDLPLVPFSSTFLKCSVEEYEDGKPTGKTEVKTKRVFISKIHSETMEKDIVETYIKYVKEDASSISDKDDRAKFLAPVNGWRGKDGKWNPGILPSLNHVCYALDGGAKGTIGRLELNNTVVSRMEQINMAEESNEPITTDLFSDPDSGVSLIIDYDKTGKKASDKYVVTKREYKHKAWIENGGYEAFIESERVSDEKLKELLQQPSLRELYKDVYTIRDFNFALDGLRRFDELHKFGIFENDEFIAEVEEIKASCPPEKQKDDGAAKADEKLKKQFEDAKAKPVASKSVEKDDSVIDFSTWNKIKCKKYLNEYIKENYGDDQTLPDLSIEDLREWCQLAAEGEELPFEDDGVDTPETNNFSDVSEQTETKSHEEPKKEKGEVDMSEQKNLSLADRIAALKAKKE